MQNGGQDPGVLSSLYALPAKDHLVLGVLCPGDHTG